MSRDSRNKGVEKDGCSEHEPGAANDTANRDDTRGNNSKGAHFFLR